MYRVQGVAHITDQGSDTSMVQGTGCAHITGLLTCTLNPVPGFRVQGVAHITDHASATLYPVPGFRVQGVAHITDHASATSVLRVPD